MGIVGEYVGGYSDWYAKHKSSPTTGTIEKKKDEVVVKPKSTTKLSYKDQKELSELLSK